MRVTHAALAAVVGAGLLAAGCARGTRTLSARLSGRSALTYRGSPRVLRADTSGGSKITHE